MLPPTPDAPKRRDLGQRGWHAQCAVCGGKAEERSEGRGVAVECVVVVWGRGLSHSLFQSLSFSRRWYVTYSLSAPIFSGKEYS